MRTLIPFVSMALLAVAGLSAAEPVNEFYRTDYGELLHNTPGVADVWWCDATRKVPRNRAVPVAKAEAASLAAARNDREAVQLVVRATRRLAGLTATASPLTGQGGATIAAENVKILRVYYHLVDHPTDKTSVSDWWPDALPPLKQVDVADGLNQPLWILVSVPKDAAPGDYTGTVALKAQGWEATVPLKLHVWNFALPDRNHLETAFGLNMGEVFRYHQAQTETDKRTLTDLYLQILSEHRISPYSSTPLDPIVVKFLPEAKPPRAEVDFTRFDAAMTKAVEQYHFTNFALPIQGIGGGTYQGRQEPSIGDFGESSPEYQAMFQSQVQQIEEHLKAKGWLDMAYVYWFDEPEPKDYAFVRGGMERIKKYGPGIRTMLTEEPGDALAGPIDIWCPVSSNYNQAAAEKRQALGEKVWWYVCCGPKEPYCTLFIDHPATDLRVWHWQTWQRNIVGTLVWSANYWTSPEAYPDRPQNPYEDPMSYVTDSSFPAGTRKHWGNGDGRFVYPPESAAVPGLNGAACVLEPPVSSIRFEMLREGVEDYEYLWLLRDLLARHGNQLNPEEAEQFAALLTIPAEITSDLTHFTKEPTPIYARRAAIAAAIERLAQ